MLCKERKEVATWKRRGLVLEPITSLAPALFPAERNQYKINAVPPIPHTGRDAHAPSCEGGCCFSCECVPGLTLVLPQVKTRPLLQPLWPLLLPLQSSGKGLLSCLAEEGDASGKDSFCGVACQEARQRSGKAL